MKKKEECFQSRKQLQEQRRKIDNYQDQSFYLLDKLNAFDTDGNLIRNWNTWRMNVGSLKNW